ncbi:hypothetical protein PsorP6_000439 [Peronosclerospora sorghi]|uniref:Uncharacterized protein n=1 Tax=Peronosclerospora sorghi TaxID=230839 RepID=A0ACC0WQQ5_9STRA|nr:hypothetical protein PsorP6_000439 [Peronosclerospora sorghi]
MALLATRHSEVAIVRDVALATSPGFLPDAALAASVVEDGTSSDPCVVDAANAASPLSLNTSAPSAEAEEEAPSMSLATLFRAPPCALTIESMINQLVNEKFRPTSAT